MKTLYTFLFTLLFSFISFSQVITFECNNEIITVSFDEIANNPNAYMDWDGDGVINELDYLIYLYQVYDCDEEGESSDGGDDEEGWGDDVVVFECDNEIITVSVSDFDNPNAWMDWNEDDLIDEEDLLIYLSEIYGCDEWGWGDNDEEEGDWDDIEWIVSDWDDFDWGSVWDEFDLDDLDWDNIPWDIIIDLGVIPEDLIDYIISIIGGQSFNWDEFIESQGCVDDNEAIAYGLSIFTDVSGCEDAIDYLYAAGFDCSSEMTNNPFLGTFIVSDICCETCLEIDGGGGDLLGCMDAQACNYNPDATVDDGSCDYGVECFVSPCSVSDNPAQQIFGAYCVDDYCNGCCALWYYADGTLISNSCEEVDCEDDDAAAAALASIWNPDIIGCEDAVPYLSAAGYSCDTDLSVLGMSGTIAEICECSCSETEPETNPMIGLWYDSEEDQYIEITESVIGFYQFIDDYLMCWYYWSIEYTYLGNGVMEVMDPEYGPNQVVGEILENENLQIIDPEGGVILLSPLDELPEIELCGDIGPVNEGCEDIYGQWTVEDSVYIIIDEDGVEIMFPEAYEGLCYEVFELSYAQDEESDVCQIFIEGYGMQFDFAEAFLNNDGTLSFILDEYGSGFPEIWTYDDSDLSGLEICSYGCTDSEACNYDPFANSDNGTCGLIDDCGDCQIPYCYDMMTSGVEYISEDECDGLWVGNDCEEDEICLSNPMNPYWNSGCVSMEENFINSKIQAITNIMGQTINPSKAGLKVYFYDDGRVEKKHIFK